MPLKNNEVLYAVSDRVATLTLNRPDKLNAWTANMELEYRAAFAEAARDPEVRVIMVTGAGRGFCAGADMGLLQSVMTGSVTPGGGEHHQAAAESGNGVRDDFKKLYSVPLAVPKPVIGAINGAAAGLGLVHALYCDIRFAADTAKFTTAFSQRGLIAEYGLAWMLPRLIGMHNALDLMYSARVITGTEAYDMGLVNRVLPAGQLMDAAREYAQHLATLSSPRSMGVIKRMAYEAQFQTLGEACDLAVEEMLASLGSDDFREGVASFLEKRKPNFPAPVA
jgi:enoyl-CoA hydratase/carnithine racemase